MSNILIESDIEALLDHSQDIITVIDEDGRLRYGNQSMERVLGYDPDILEDENVFRYVHTDDRSKVVETLVDPSRTAEAIEFRLRHANGSWVWLEAVASTQQDRSSPTANGPSSN